MVGEAGPVFWGNWIRMMLGKIILIMTLAATSSPALEQAVGLEAQGVDPWASLHNPLGLDVRDELGRPVSARLVESQIKAAAAKAAAAAAFSSRLPQAKTVVYLLEFLAVLKISWSMSLPLFHWPQSWALVPKTISSQKIPLFAIFAFIATAVSCPAFKKFCAPVSASASIPLVLRC